MTGGRLDTTPVGVEVVRSYPGSARAARLAAALGFSPAELRAARLQAELDRVLKGRRVCVAAGLTAGDYEMLDALAAGLTYAGIAERLSVTESTVKSRASALYRRLRVPGRDDALRVTAWSAP